MIGPDEILLFFAVPAALDAPDARAEALAVLAPEERERVERFHFERDRRLHLCARSLLRRSLSRCAEGVSPAAWRFAAPREHGRPEIVHPASPLRFSVSHTPGLAMVAVAWRRDVGADVERVPAVVPWDVVEQAFTGPERDLVAAASAPEQAGRFAAIWTLKEAYAKALGLGLALELRSVGFALSPPRIAAGADAAAWHVEGLAPTPEHRAAVCARTSGPGRLTVRTFGGPAIAGHHPDSACGDTQRENAPVP